MFMWASNMGMTEILFQVEALQWPIAAFTREVADSRVIMNHIRYDDDHFPTRNIFTILADDDKAQDLVNTLHGLYAPVEVLRQDPGVTSVLAEAPPDRMKILKAPFTTALRALGPDRILRPIVIRDGWMSVGIVTAARVDVGDVIRTASESFEKAGMQMRLIRWGDYRPEDHPMGDYEDKLTPKQVEVVKMGLALGYYDNPRRCTLETLANVFGISKAAAHNRIKGAERKILGQYFS